MIRLFVIRRYIEADDREMEAYPPCQCCNTALSLGVEG